MNLIGKDLLRFGLRRHLSRMREIEGDDHGKRPEGRVDARGGGERRHLFLRDRRCRSVESAILTLERREKSWGRIQLQRSEAERGKEWNFRVSVDVTVFAQPLPSPSPPESLLLAGNRFREGSSLLDLR